MSDDSNTSDGDEKPNGNSVTTVRCTCNYLQRASKEPESPIVFDEDMNEYHIARPAAARGGSLIIYHCPWCGGAAPHSRRDTFFAHITQHESARLHALADDVKTVEDAIAKFGQPARDFPRGQTCKTPASDTEPATVTSYRVLYYTGLSETADIRLIDFGPERGLRCSLTSKYIGKPKE